MCLPWSPWCHQCLKTVPDSEESLKYLSECGQKGDSKSLFASLEPFSTCVWIYLIYYILLKIRDCGNNLSFFWRKSHVLALEVYFQNNLIGSIQFSSVAQSSPTLCDPMKGSGARPPCPSPLPDSPQILWVSDAIYSRNSSGLVLRGLDHSLGRVMIKWIFPNCFFSLKFFWPVPIKCGGSGGKISKRDNCFYPTSFPRSHNIFFSVIGCCMNILELWAFTWWRWRSCDITGRYFLTPCKHETLQ